MFCVITPETQPAPLELGHRAVRAVGLLAVQHREALAVEGPEARRVAAPDGDVRDLHRVDVRPQPVIGVRKSGIPDGTEIPAPVRTTTGPELTDQLREALGAHLPLNSGVRFSMKAAMPSRASSETNARRNASRSAASPSSRSPACETRLICSTAIGAWPRQLAPPGERDVEQLVVLDDAVDEPVLEGLLGRDRLADGVHLQRLGRADEPGEPLRAAEAGDDPEVDLGLAEGRRARGQADVAGHRDLAAAAEREPVDGGDRHDRRPLPLAPERVDALEVRRGPTPRPTW